MLFLLNDTLLTLKPDATPPPPAVMARVSLETITQLGAELFAANPALQRTDLKKAEKLAMLIVMRNPSINAALFVAPSAGCAPSQVATRYAEVSLEALGALLKRHVEGTLTSARVDEMIWGSLKAA